MSDREVLYTSSSYYTTAMGVFLLLLTTLSVAVLAAGRLRGETMFYASVCGVFGVIYLLVPYRMTVRKREGGDLLVERRGLLRSSTELVPAASVTKVGWLNGAYWFSFFLVQSNGKRVSFALRMKRWVMSAELPADARSSLQSLADELGVPFVTLAR